MLANRHRGDEQRQNVLVDQLSATSSPSVILADQTQSGMEVDFTLATARPSLPSFVYGAIKNKRREGALLVEQITRERVASLRTAALYATARRAPFYSAAACIAACSATASLAAARCTAAIAAAALRAANARTCSHDETNWFHGEFSLFLCVFKYIFSMGVKNIISSCVCK